MATETEERIEYESPVITWKSEPRFRIPGVLYRGKQGNCLLFEKMTPKITQDNLIKLYESEKTKGNPVPTDAPLIWAIATRAHELKGENPEAVEKLRQFLKNGFRRYPNTLTRIHYSPENDVVVHNIGTSDQYSLEGNVVGPDCGIDQIPDKKVLESLLGTQDISQINAVSQWFNGTDFYIWRLNSMPKQLDKRLARFGASDSRLVLICGRVPLSEFPAFRVLQAD